MRSVAVVTRRFLDHYRGRYEEYKKQAELLEKFIRHLLSDSEIDIHKIEARAKDPASLHLKLLKKRYKRPWVQLTDKVGARIITYYSSDVDEVVAALRPELELDAQNSVDKRGALGTRAFGYSSVHLIARLKEKHLRNPEYSSLSGLWFEIQVRSILEHAWAEIEHEVVMKSGVVYPEGVIRRFSAIAGALEFVGGGFHLLRGERNELIESYKERYAKGLDGSRGFDAARLLGYLEFRHPTNISWRGAERDGRPFPPRIEAVCVVALRACRLSMANALGSIMKTRKYKNAVKNYSAALNIGPEKVSHLALILIAIALRSPRMLGDYFPSFSKDPGLMALSHRGN